ncbi:MAG: serine hydrolase [Afipia sp.]|jgi:CubicO group peptidase (beta-lactamase class C family)|nr:serine hydrolase [Afipia sp.]MBS4005471.1 serine hydrolase [Afipia sp.]WIG52540.1 MAG: Beta-lactamase class C-like and penicillin binding proteins (PBPs) superfamily [Afipia sp.]
MTICTHAARYAAALLALTGAGTLSSTALNAQTAQPLPTAAQTDPKTLGLMQGFPPPPDKTIRFIDGSSSRFPNTRWSFSHFRELVPTAAVSRGEGPVVPLPRAEKDLGAVAITTMDGKAITFNDAMQLTYTDGIVVLHKGKIIYEKYFGEGSPQLPHIAFSVTKSFVGTLAAVLAANGKLDPAAPVTKYVPELKDTAYGDATVRQVMDMTIGVKFSENYSDPNAEVFDYARAGGMMPIAPGYQGPRSFYDFLVKLNKEGEHGQAFAYKTANAEVLAWIVKRASGQSLAALLSSEIWSKLGAEQDGYFMVDSIGTESGGGGYNTALRDLARFGEMMRNKGKFNGQQVIPEAAVADITQGGKKDDFAKAGYTLLKGWSYRDMWWITHNEHNAYTARGIYGQSIYVDPTAEMVIARYASHPMAANAANDPVSLPMYMALAKELMK